MNTDVKSIFLAKHMISQSLESAVFLELSPDIINDNSESNFFHNMTPSVAIPDTDDTLVMNNLDKPWY